VVVAQTNCARFKTLGETDDSVRRIARLEDAIGKPVCPRCFGARIRTFKRLRVCRIRALENSYGPEHGSIDVQLPWANVDSEAIDIVKRAKWLDEDHSTVSTK